MGKDKVENEDLIKYGFPEDIWFHVDKHSSAHVYLRMPKEIQNLDEIPANVVEDCCQLVKANSIEGSKLNNVSVVYTFWSNLKKTSAMDVGQVGFQENKLIRKFTVEKKKNDILNRLSRTKDERYPNLAGKQNDLRKPISERTVPITTVDTYVFYSKLLWIWYNEAIRADRDKQERDQRKEAMKEKVKMEKIQMEKEIQEGVVKHYVDFMDPQNMKTNRDIQRNAQDFEDNFM